MRIIVKLELFKKNSSSKIENLISSYQSSEEKSLGSLSPRASLGVGGFGSRARVRTEDIDYCVGSGVGRAFCPQDVSRVMEDLLVQIAREAQSAKLTSLRKAAQDASGSSKLLFIIHFFFLFFFWAFNTRGCFLRGIQCG